MKSSLLLLAAGLAIAVGCHDNSVPPPVQPRQDVYHTTDPTQVFIDSDALRNDTAADTPTVVRDPSGLLHVTVPIRSVTDHMIRIDYRVMFYDRDHMLLDTSPWTSKFLTPNVPDSVSITATNPRSEYFQVHFRYPEEGP